MVGILECVRDELCLEVSEISLQGSGLLATSVLLGCLHLLDAFPRPASVMKAISWKELPGPNTISGAGEVMIPVSN